MGVRLAVVGVSALKGASLSVPSPTKANVSGPMMRGGLRRLSALRAVPVMVVVGLLSVGLSSQAVAADTCANAAVRATTGSTGLPDCRAYEMVSAPYKEGFPVLGGVGFTDGGIVSYRSRGAFAGNVQGNPTNQYHATRSATGWLTGSLDPPAETYGVSLDAQVGLPVVAESSDLRWSLWRMYRHDETEVNAGYWLRDPDGVFTRVGNVSGPGGRQGVNGASANDLSHIVLSAGLSGSASSTAQYEYVGTGNGGLPRAISVDNVGQRTPGETCLRDVSPDGRVIVFVSGCWSGVLQVWARVGGSATVAVSGSECTRDADDDGGLCNGVSAAAYEGGAADGSRVFFTTSQQLVNGDVDQGNDLYACDIPGGAPVPAGSANPCSTLTEVSGTASDAQVQSVVSISEDGSRVYFVARGVLADNLGLGDIGPRAGAENLYVWDRDGGDPAGHMRYVARLAHADDVDGSDGSLPGNDLGQAQMTPDGRYLLFTTANRLLTVGAGSDTDLARDVYRYDAATHTIVRVSMSVAGGGGDGSFDAAIPAGFDVSIPVNGIGHDDRDIIPVAMSADGSTVVFDSAEALSASDSNGVTDVYSWRDGQVSLISADGGSSVGVTASGRDVFFSTEARVLGADRDANTDLYDARVGGGFEPAQLPSPCFGDACQGQRSQPPSLAGPSAPLLDGDGLLQVAPGFSLRAVSATQRRTAARSGKVTLSVSANVPGTVTARATATMDGRSVAVGSARRVLAVPGRAAVTLTLSKRARSQLASRGRLTVRVSVSHSKVALERSATLRLVRAKAKRSTQRASARRSLSSVDGGRS